MGFDLGNFLLGGLGASTNPADYKVANPQQQQIDALMRQGSAQLDPSQQAQFRAMQVQQAQALQRVASGQQQGAGELAAQRQVANAVAAQQAQARMARGGNAALAMRNAANNVAGIGLSGAGQAQQAALQDQSNAMGQLTGALGSARGQDIGFAGQNAQLTNQRYGENLNAVTGLNAQQLQAQQQAMQAAQSQQGLLGGLLNAGGQVLGAYVGGKFGGGGGGYQAPGELGMGGPDDMYTASPAVPSDRDLKADIKENAGGDVDEMLRKLVAKTYRYKNETKYGAGERVGVMAQDMLKSKMGAAIVRKDPDGLKIDVGKAVSAALASTARLDERLRKLERA